MIDDRKSQLQIARANWPLYIRSYRAFQTYDNLVAESTSREFRHVTTILLQGSTATGKTRLAMSYSPYKIIGTKKDLSWFDGYAGEDVLLIDEFDCQSVPMRY